MGPWDVGPFDNDTAADWCGGLHDSAPVQRPTVVRRALTAVLDSGDDYLDSDRAVEAIAAAIVASQLPGGVKIASPYAPDFLLAGGGIELPAMSRRWPSGRWTGSPAKIRNGASYGKNPMKGQQPSQSSSRSARPSTPP